MEKKVMGIKVRDYVYFMSAIVFATLLNAFVLRPNLYQSSIDYIIDLQTRRRDPYLLIFFNTIRKLGSTWFIYGTLLLIYVFKERALAFHYTLVISFMMFFLVFMKMLIRFPRPYQYSPEVMPTTCSGQYGCPSATTIRVTTLLASLFFDFVHERRHKMGVVKYTLMLCLNVFCIGSVMVSRVYLAAHSINQVIFGGSIGFSISVFLYFSVKP
jgi:membrane-associated phospholipid phosphatase